MTRERNIDLPYPPPYQTVDVLARHLCVNTDTVNRWVKDGTLPLPVERKSPKGARLWSWKSVCQRLDGTQDKVGQSLDPFVEGAKRAAQERQRNGRAA